MSDQKTYSAKEAAIAVLKKAEELLKICEFIKYENLEKAEKRLGKVYEGNVKPELTHAEMLTQGERAHSAAASGHSDAARNFPHGHPLNVAHIKARDMHTLYGQAKRESKSTNPITQLRGQNAANRAGKMHAELHEAHKNDVTVLPKKATTELSGAVKLGETKPRASHDQMLEVSPTRHKQLATQHKKLAETNAAHPSAADHQKASSMHDEYSNKSNTFQTEEMHENSGNRSVKRAKALHEELSTINTTGHEIGQSKELEHKKK